MLFRDSRFAIIDKPAGVAVHPSRGDPTPSIEDGFASLGRFRDGPWLAHRLDRDTAGCLLVALRRSALRAAQDCFSSGQVQKLYWAIVDGVPSERDGEVVSLLGRVEAGGRWRMAPSEDGARAVTRWRLRGTDGRVSWLELQPLTGRTHQVRAHCLALGCPVSGDAVYGGSGGRLQLLARSLRLPLEPPVAAEAPVPEHMRDALGRFGALPQTPPDGRPSR